MNEIVPRNKDVGDGHQQGLVPQAKQQSPIVSSEQNLTPEEQARKARVQHKANMIRTLAFSAAMATAVPVAKEIGSAAFKVYQDDLLREAGSPTDPVERMLLEQLTLAHHRVAQLHAQAEQVTSIEAAKVYMTAATRLTGEVRRLALALKQYREPSGKKQFMVVRQQNVSTGGQQVAYLDQTRAPKGQIPFDNVGNELGTKRLEHAPQAAIIPESQSQAPSGRAAEPALAWPADAGRARAAATVGAREPTLDALDGAEDRPR